nr:unnamed protein product [Callosobruchus analis]
MFDARLLDGAPPGPEASTTDSGWTNDEKFINWIQLFVHKIRPTKDKKALLVSDNHESHKSYAALQFASENNVIFLSIPPHTPHKFQPLDVAVYGPIKKYFEIEINVFQKPHSGRIINQFNVARLFSAAYLKRASQSNEICGFRASGIYPYNRHAISEEYLAPSEIYEFERAEGEGDTQSMQTTADKVIKQIRQGRRKQKAEILTSTPIRNEQKRKADAAAAKRKVYDDGSSPSKVSKQPTKTPRGEENVQSDCFCTICSEPYIDPPIEDFIQYDTCRRWTHEAFSSYVRRDAYYCDDCDD